MPGDRCSLGTQPCFPSSLLPSLGMAPPAPPCTCHLDGAQPHLHGLPPTTCPSPFAPHLTETAPPPEPPPPSAPFPAGVLSPASALLISLCFGVQLPICYPMSFFTGRIQKPQTLYLLHFGGHAPPTSIPFDRHFHKHFTHEETEAHREVKERAQGHTARKCQA